MDIDEGKFREVFDLFVAPVIDGVIAELVADGCTPEEAELEVYECFKRALDETLHGSEDCSRTCSRVLH